MRADVIVISSKARDRIKLTAKLDSHVFADDLPLLLQDIQGQGEICVSPARRAQAWRTGQVPALRQRRFYVENAVFCARKEMQGTDCLRINALILLYIKVPCLSFVC